MYGDSGESDASGTIELPLGAQLKQNLAYGPSDEQRLDVYFPPAPHGSPVLFMVHGGAWMIGDKGATAVVQNKVRYFLPKGYIFVSVNYRLLPPDPLRQAGDVARALAFAQSQASAWGGDPDRFVLMGHSAGAHLVALLTSDPSLASAACARPTLGTVALDSAAFDVDRIMREDHPRFYDRVFKKDPGYWRSASPLHRLSAAPKPMLAVCSSQRDDSCVQAQAFAAKVAGLGGRAQVYPIDLSHREINLTLGEPSAYTDAVVAFLRSLGLP